MADEQDEIKADDAPVRHDRISIIGPDAPKLITAAAIGAAVGAAVTHFLSDFRSGDEAPIRIKGGSTIIELLDDRATWKEETGSNKMKWFLSRGTRSRPEYDVLIVVKKPSGQLRSVRLEGKKIEIHRDAQSWVEFQAAGKKTKVTSQRERLTLGGFDQVLSHVHNITEVRVDSDVPFIDGDGELVEVLILDTATIRHS